MTDPLLVGCDIGTSAVKAVVAGADGALLGRAVAEHPMHHPRPGWAENDPGDWYAGMCAAVRQALAQARAGAGPARVAALCVVCQREPVVLLDAAGAPLARAISWTDGRAAAQAAAVTARFGQRWLIEQTGMVPAAGMSLAHLLWFAAHRRDTWRAVRRIRFAKDYLLHRLTGCAATDPTTPGRSGLMDVRGQRWSEEICDAFAIDPALLPPIRGAPWGQAGELSAAAAGDLGLPPGLPVAMGGADDAAATLGGGAASPGEVCVGTGTAANWRTVLARCEPDLSARGDVSPHVVPGRYLHELAIESTGASLRWLRDALGEPGFDDLAAGAGAAGCGAGGLLFFPFVAGAARAPRYAAGARGAFIGVVSGHTRAHLARAVLEGVAYQYRATMPILGSVAVPITIGDGEARSALWTQIKADVLGVPLRVPRIADLAAAGAVILAGLAAGVYRDAASGIEHVVRWDRRYDPDPARTAAYAELSARYERAYARIEQTFHRPAPGDPITSGYHRGAHAS